MELDTAAQNHLDVNTDSDVTNISEEFLDISPSRSLVFSKAYPGTSNVSAKFCKKFCKEVQSPQAASTCSKLTADTKLHRNDEKVSSKCSQKLGRSLSPSILSKYCVETSFLPSSNKLKQSRLVFQPANCDKEGFPKQMIKNFPDKKKHHSLRSKTVRRYDIDSYEQDETFLLPAELYK